MDTIYNSVRNVLLVICISTLAFGKESNLQEAVPKTNRKPVVVELFTSEGCSTCPPADALLAKLETRQPVEDAYVIALEEHVDYWNQGGWIDPFSEPEWTQRQQAYVSKLKAGNAYTPQMIVDGGIQFVGNHEQEAEQVIKAAVRGMKTEITVMLERPAESTCRFSVRVGKLIGNTPGDSAEVWLGVAETGLQSAVKGGENAGKVLQHAAVLHSLRKVGLATSDSEVSLVAAPEVKLKSSWNRANLQIVVFVQEKKSWRILGASSTKIVK